MDTRNKCYFCRHNIDAIDYKDIELISKFITKGGKILGRRTTRVCARHQKKLAQAIKRARNLALIPFTAGHY
ncbi:MAG TPA: 30S ribosomal protein S18 [bacterium (Candidatus Stahlbacteria)]|nr:30S ribosomal protein S18 [Candidatus Stahlbacteria bacterium]